LVHFIYASFLGSRKCMASFERLGVIPEIIQATQKLEWLLPTPVQDEAIPLILGGGDVMVAAETGSGKTAAFGIPIIQTVYETLRGEGGTGGPKKQSKSKAPQNQDQDIGPITLTSQACDKQFVADGLKGSSTHNTWQGGRANIGVMKGRYYFEINVLGGGVRVGWATTAASYGCGLDTQSWGYGFTAKKAHGGNFEEYGEKFGAGDFVGCYIDFKRKEISYSKNGEFMGVAFDSIPNMGNSPIYPAVVAKKGSVRFNFGSADWTYPPEKGFRGIQHAKWNETSAYFRQMAKDAELREGKRNKNIASPLAVILSPTRDLSQQIYNDIKDLSRFCKEPPIHSCLAIGGVSRMMADVMKAHILVGSMGSVTGLVKTKKVTLASCKFFILDEADRVLCPKQGNQADVMAMYSRLPDGVQVMLFSATLHSDPIREMSEKLCKNPMWVDLKGKEFVPDTVHHSIFVVDPNADRQWTVENKITNNIITDGVHHQGDNIQWNSRGNLTDLTKSEAIKMLKPIILKKIIDAFQMDQCLIFCRTRLDCDNLEKFLTAIGGGKKFMGATSSGKENPYSCTALHSGIPQNRRGENLKLFKDGDVRFLICTDVAARGIDIKNLPYVINMTMPAEDEDYVHRVGRVGRADKPGIALSIISSQREKVWYHSNCPDRGRYCKNTNLVERGGCCIWYDEVKIFEKVEKRLGGNPIPILDQNKHLNSSIEIQSFIKDVAAKDPLVAESEKKLKKLLPTIRKLNALEVTAQNQALMMHNRFAGIFDGNGKMMQPGAVRKRKGKKKRLRGRDRRKQKQKGPAKG